MLFFRSKSLLWTGFVAFNVFLLLFKRISYELLSFYGVVHVYYKDIRSFYTMIRVF